MKFTAAQFDPSLPYPEGAWCHGEYQFYCATPRSNNVKLHRTDWIIEFENGERIVVTNATYEEFFKGLLATQEVESSNEDMAERPVRSSDAEPVEGEDPKPRKQRNSPKRDRSSGADGLLPSSEGEQSDS